MSALLTFSLGPVQPLIAQARKTQDLWIGSYLLAMLMRDGLRSYPGELLFPVLDSAAAGTDAPSAIADLPNKFVARHDTIAEAVAAATMTRERIEESWRTLANSVWELVFKQEQDATLATIWQRQTDPTTLFEIYWAVVPYDDGSHTVYGLVYQRAQALLDARKRLRTFAAADEPGEKSTISGEREALHPAAAALHAPPGAPPGPADRAAPTDTAGRPDGSREVQSVTAAEVRAFWQELAQQFPAAQLGRSGRERLDAVDLIKRFATAVPRIGLTISFPSTDSVAAAPFFSEVIHRLQQTAAPSPLHTAAQAWISCAENAYRAAPKAVPALDRAATSPLARRLLSCDAEALHVESFSPRRLQDSPLDQARYADLTEHGPQVVRDFLRHARDAAIASPSSYYAVLLLDGDHMGQLLSSIPTPEDHRRLSETLSAFAHTHPRDIVEGDACGRVVYAGGDDVLAFLPALPALRAARDLRAAYGRALSVFRQQAPGVTASAGIAIAHRRMPLRMVLAAARDAEHAAKERYGRDALSVSLLRRSGAITLVGAHWSSPLVPSSPVASAPDVVHAVLEVSVRLRAGDLSNRFVYALLEEAPVLAALDGAARRAELMRLLRRQRAPERVEHFPNDTLDALAEELAALTLAFDQALPGGLPPEAGYDLTAEGPRRGVVELSGWLLIAAFLARGEEED